MSLAEPRPVEAKIEKESWTARIELENENGRRWRREDVNVDSFLSVALGCDDKGSGNSNGPLTRHISLFEFHAHARTLELFIFLFSDYYYYFYY